MCLTGAEYCERSSVPVKQRRVLRNFFIRIFFFFFFYIFQSPGKRVFEVFQKREKKIKNGKQLMILSMEFFVQSCLFVSNCNQTLTNCFHLEDSKANRSGGKWGLPSKLKCNFLKS